MSHTTPRHSAETPQHMQGTSSHQQDTVLSALHQMELTRRDALKALFAAVGAATLFGSPIAALAEPQATQETLNALSDAQAKYDEVKQQLDDIAAQYQELSKKQSETLSQIEDVQDKIDEKQEQIDDTQEEIEAKQEELEEKQEYLAARVASNYKAGGTSALSLLLSSTSFNELISNAYYLDKINESDQRAIEEVHRIQEELAEEKRALEDQKAELEQQKSQLETLKDQQAQQLSDMQDKQAEVQEVLNGLDQDVKDLMAQRDAEILAAAQAEAEAAREREEAAKKQQQTGGGATNIPEVGSGQDYNAASAAQKKIVNSCYYTPSPGANYCAAWVSHVFRNAGFGRVYGNANDMYNNWCTSSRKADLQVGMIIAVSTYSKNYAGRVWGHVGIYIGDNKIMENIGFINTNNLDSWIRYYGDTVSPRWGWANGINLASQ